MHVIVVIVDVVVGFGCGASLVVFASAVAMQGRLLGVCMSHNQSIAVTSLCNKSC